MFFKKDKEKALFDECVEYIDYFIANKTLCTTAGEALQEAAISGSAFSILVRQGVFSDYEKIKNLYKARMIEFYTEEAVFLTNIFETVLESSIEGFGIMFDQREKYNVTDNVVYYGTYLSAIFAIAAIERAYLREDPLMLAVSICDRRGRVKFEFVEDTHSIVQIITTVLFHMKKKI